MIKLKGELWAHSRAKAGGKFQRIIDTWDDMIEVGLGNPTKTLVVPPNSEALRTGCYDPILSDISEVFGKENLIFRSDADFEDVDGRRAAGVLESHRCYSKSNADRRRALEYVVDSVKSPRALAYICKHGIRNPGVGVGVQTFVRSIHSAKPDLSGVVNSAYRNRIEVTMVRDWGDELNRTRNYKYWVTYDRKTGKLSFNTSGPRATPFLAAMSGEETCKAIESICKEIKEVARYVIKAVLELESRWGIHGTKGIDMEFATADLCYPSSTVHVQNNEIPIPEAFEVP